MFQAILNHLSSIASHVEDLTGSEHIPVQFLRDIFSGIIANHNETFLVDDIE